MRRFILFFVFFLSTVFASDSEPTAKIKKYALVTGASRGIGQALVEVLIEKDPYLQVFAVARGEKDLENLANSYPGKVIPIVADISQSEGCEKIQRQVRTALSENGVLSYLVHNAALIHPLGDLDYLQNRPLGSMLSEMDLAYRVNVIVPHLLTIALLPELKRAKNGKVLLVSSRAGEIALPGMVTYSCTKAALDHLALNLKASLQNEVAVGVLHPGEVDTDMQTDLRTPPESQLAIAARFREAKINQRLISSKVSAKFIAYLLCDTSFEEFSEKKWDIYFIRPSRFPQWLSEEIGFPPGYLKPVH